LEEAKRFRAKATLNPSTVAPRSGPTIREYAEEWLTPAAQYCTRIGKRKVHHSPRR